MGVTRSPREASGSYRYGPLLGLIQCGMGVEPSRLSLNPESGELFPELVNNDAAQLQHGLSHVFHSSLTSGKGDTA